MDTNTTGDNWSDVSFEKDDQIDESSTAKRVCTDKKRTLSGATKSSTTPSTSSTIVNIPVHNRYSALTPPNDNNVSEINLNRKQNNQEVPKKERIPPITVKNMSRIEVIQLCTGLRITNYSIKPIDNTSFNVYLVSVEDFRKMRKFVADTNIPAFTHNLQSELSFRVVLKGLYCMDISELKEQLKLQRIVPDDITIIPMKKRRFDDQALYLLYFKKGSTNINELRKCQFLSYMRIDWELYSPRSNGPVRCRKCQSWGHGCKNCWLPTACMYCAENHMTKDCKEIVNGTPVRADFVPCCANCNKAHPANFDKCEVLLKHMERQASLALRNSKLVKSRSQKVNRPSSITAPSKPVYSFSQPLTNQTSSRLSYANVIRNATNYSSQQSTQLMSVNELLALTKELVSSLRNCRTREQQFDVMTSLAIKYVYGDGCP